MDPTYTLCQRIIDDEFHDQEEEFQIPLFCRNEICVIR